MKLVPGKDVSFTYGNESYYGKFCYYFGKAHAMIKTKYGAELIVPTKIIKVEVENVSDR